MALEIVVLAAGKGSRMKSSLPKVLHTLAGKTLLEHVLNTALALSPDKIHVVIGHQADKVKTTLENVLDCSTINWVHQTEQLGTGHAVVQALPAINPAATVLVMAGDVPMIQAATLLPLCQPTPGVNLLTAIMGNPHGLGRIIRENEHGSVREIVEHKDATSAQLEIQEINAGVLAASAKQLDQWLAKVKNNNAQAEYYLPDIIGLAVNAGVPVNASIAEDSTQIMGINSRAQLAELERQYQRQQAEHLMDEGVGLADPNRLDIRGTLRAGIDCFIDINAVFEQDVQLGKHVRIGPNVLIRNSQIGDHCVIEANSVIDNATIAENCQIGPFARVRPETKLHAGSKIGNFVEIKKSEIGAGSKVNHLSYIGDSTVGRDVNIGAGVITCNYDGANKHQTIIEDNVFVGSDCQLIAPVKIGEGANIGAGSTIRKNAPAHMLSLSKSRQIQIEGWKRPVKKQ